MQLESNSPDKQAEFFDSIAAHWDEMEVADINDRLARVVTASGIKPGWNVLDVGTGTGVIIPVLLSAMEARGQITGIDVSGGMLAVARNKRFPSNVVLIQTSLHEFECSSPLDAVICNAVYPHFDNPEASLYKIYKMLKPGGLIAISHAIGREAVNKIHADSDSVVRQDTVPAALEMKRLLTNVGFRSICVVDETEFYMALGYVPCR